MPYLIASGENQPMIGAIKIISTKHPDAPSDATSVRVSRRDMATTTWVDITSVPISAPAKLTFSFLDKNVASGHTYRYSFTPVVGGADQPPVSIDVACSFNGIFVADATGEYMASLNLDYKSKKNIHVSYVQTLAGKYPHAVRNSNANYFSGSVEGIFTRYTETCEPDIASMNAYKDEVIEMLSNGLLKTIRTYDGHNWLVSIDGEPSRNMDQFINSDTISFNWTEVGNFPTTGVIML